MCRYTTFRYCFIPIAATDLILVFGRLVVTHGFFWSQIGSNGTKQWRYYDYGPKSVAPLVCLSGTAGTADVFYKQILTLCLKVRRIQFNRWLVSL